MKKEKQNFIRGMERWLEKPIGKPDAITDYQISYYLRRGSAVFCVSVIFPKTTPPLFRISCSLVRLPKENILAFYRKLLENNRLCVFGGCFAVVNDQVLLVYDRPFLDIDESEVYQSLDFFAKKADKWDHELKNEFGCEILGIEEKSGTILDEFFDF